MNKIKREVSIARDKTFETVEKNNKKFSKTATIMTLGSRKYVVIPFGGWDFDSVTKQLEYELTNFAINIHEENIIKIVEKILTKEGIIMADKI